jgi:hypothetical protein
MAPAPDQKDGVATGCSAEGGDVETRKADADATARSKVPPPAELVC